MADIPATIFALSSGRPPAAIAIIRVSGPGAQAAAEQIAGALPPAREAALRRLRDPASGEPLDHGLVLRFDGPASVTGEDTVEFHMHGGRAVADSMLDAMASLPGLRAALPGEFTRRAFEHGRIDLTEAEGLADLLEAETQSQRRAALALAEGGLRRQIELWQGRLIELAARAEAAIDYVDDDATTADSSLSRDCEALSFELADWLARPCVEPLREGVRVVVAGPPNAGKSSLINCLAGLDRAIVTPVAGTTRDAIEVPLALDGVAIILTDTAGLRTSSDPVEAIGVERARDRIEGADVLLWLGCAEEAPVHPQRILIHPRCDLAERRVPPEGSLAVSSLTNEGVGDLLARIGALVRTILPADDLLALNRRQALHLEEAHADLAEIGGTTDIVMVAEHLRSARGAFDRLTGRAGVDDLLDALFARFCLGK
jgi:tRNA modification GTPase